MMYNPMMMKQPMMTKADGDGAGDFSTGGASFTGGAGGGDSIGDAGFGSGPVNGGSNMPNPIQGGLGSFLNGLGSAVTNQLGNFSGVLSNPMLIPSLTAAMQQFHQAHQYTDMAEGYAHQLDPFGQQRPAYQQMLLDAYQNPAKVLQNPAYQAMKTQGLNDVGRSQAAQGYLGSGNMMQALEDYSSSKDLSYLNQIQQSLQTPAGANIGPQSAAAMLSQGLAGRMGAENNAVGNLMVPFLAQNEQNRGTNVTVNNGAGNPNGQNPFGGASAQQILSNPALRAMLPAAMQSWSPTQLAQWMQYNQPLTNGSLGNWLTGDQGGDGTSDGIDNGNIMLPPVDDGSGITDMGGSYNWQIPENDFSNIDWGDIFDFGGGGG